MIRIGLLSVVVLAASLYAYKDWFKSLCVLIALMAFAEHPDLPRSMGGVPGLNLWNILFLNVVGAWVLTRGRDGHRWDMGWKVNFFLFLYFLLIAVGVRRLMLQVHVVEDEVFLMQGSEMRINPAGFIFEYLYNTCKWAVPGLLLMDGCRTRERFYLGIIAVLSLYVLLALQTAKWISPVYLMDAAALTRRALKILRREVGYHRVNMSMMLAGASWALFTTHVLLEKRYRLFVLGGAALVFYAQALTAGRTGYVTWAILGLIFGVLRWRKMLLVVPVAILAVVLFAPGVVDRMMQGFRGEEGRMVGESSEIDADAVTAGRSKIWPHVIEKIKERPLIGYGRLAMYHTGLVRYGLENLGEPFSHPHNAFLEFLLDNGVVGLGIVLTFYLIVLWNAFQLFFDSRSPIFVATGGIAIALTGAFLVATVGGQTFYPRQENVGMYCAMGMALRVGLERRRLLARSAAGEQDAPLQELRPTAVVAGTRAPGGHLPPGAHPPPGAVPDGWDRQLWARS